MAIRSTSLSLTSSLCAAFFLASCAGEDNPVTDGGRRDTGVRADVPTDVGGAVDVPGMMGVDVPTVVGDGGACRTNDECTAPDLCTNARQCIGGRCTVTGGVPTCDDSVACTDDRCDAMMGRCTHVPNDMRCPGGQFCIEGNGCLAEVPCEVGDTTCQRLNSNACMGTWSCDAARRRCIRSAPPSCDDRDMCTTDMCMPMAATYTCTTTPMFDYQTNAMHCGGCMMACPMRANADAACMAGACRYTCQMGAVDGDGDLNAARMAMSNGCECRGDGMPDNPDLMFRDNNCDGIDGDINRAIFVATTGNDGNPGTMAMPMATIQAAIARAASMMPRKDVYVAGGIYRGQISLQSGVSVYGGYNSARVPWTRAMMNTTTIDSPAAVGVVGDGLAQALTLQLLSIRSANAMMPGASSYGVRLSSNAGAVSIIGCRITAGDGSFGSDGTDSPPAANASPGGMGANGSSGGAGGGTGGGGGASNCAPGGMGGLGGYNDGGGASGGDGSTAPGGGRGGTGGAGSAAGAVCFSGAGPGSPGTNGAAGSNGVPGVIAMNLGASMAAGFSPGIGNDGTPGTPGGGGGAGGGGGGGRSSGLCNADRGGGGGGGGGGGCNGGRGTGGNGGGGSFALFISASPVILDATQLVTGNGGRGGRGGNGAAGGFGAPGGGRGSGPDDGGDGGLGGAGANGGAGGSGSGGPGGPSYCVQYLGVGPMINQMNCMRGTGGPGGAGGSSPVGMAPSGPVGASEDLHSGA